MSKLVSVVQAAQNTIATYLANAINNPTYGTKPDSPVTVEPRWPDPKKLPPKAITIVAAGPRSYGSEPVLGWWHDAQRVSPQPPNMPPGLVMWRWTVGWYEQPVQLDIWCLYDIDRDDLIARLDIALHAGPGETTSKVGDPIADYLVLPLSQADGWPNAFCGAYFAEDGPTLTDTATNAGQNMYRATWNGTIEVLLTIDAPSYPIARMIFKERMSATGVPVSGNYDLQMTVSSSGHPATFAKNVP